MCSRTLLTSRMSQKASKVGTIANVFGEDVTGVADSRDAVDVNLLGVDDVTNSAVLEVDVVHVLCVDALGPDHSSVAVVVQIYGSVGVGEAHVATALAKRRDFLDGFVCGINLSLASGKTEQPRGFSVVMLGLYTLSTGALNRVTGHVCIVSNSKTPHIGLVWVVKVTA